MISIIIPTLNEKRMIGRCLRQFDKQPGAHEIIVVDGGSRDNTAGIVNTFPKSKLIRVEESGRGRQMNQGARIAKGDILLFLHADTLLPPGGLRMIEAMMGRQNVVAGSFFLRFDHPDRMLHIFSRLSRINHILFTYGDQGLFLSKATFEKLGGFAEIPLMEDVEIQQRLRKIGRFVKLSHCVVTSPRRFVFHGILRQQLLNTGLVMLYHAGISPFRLNRYYHQMPP
jgi:rSAM/selenodomain-associated transferase 2